MAPTPENPPRWHNSEHPREIWHDQHEVLIFQLSQPTRSVLAAEGARPSLWHLRGLHSTTVRRVCRIAKQSFGRWLATVLRLVVISELLAVPSSDGPLSLA